jgi:hypothetical protein
MSGIDIPAVLRIQASKPGDRIGAAGKRPVSAQ